MKKNSVSVLSEHVSVWTSALQTILLIGEEHTVTLKCPSSLDVADFIVFQHFRNPEKFFDVYLESWEERDLKNFGKNSLRTPLQRAQQYFRWCLNHTLEDREGHSECFNNMQFHAIDIRQPLPTELVMHNYDFLRLYVFAAQASSHETRAWISELEKKVQNCLDTVTILKRESKIQVPQRNQAYRVLGIGMKQMDSKRFDGTKRLILQSLLQQKTQLQSDIELIRRLETELTSLAQKIPTSTVSELRSDILDIKDILLKGKELVYEWSGKPMDLFLLTKLAKQYSSKSRPNYVRNAIVFAGLGHIEQTRKYLTRLGFVQQDVVEKADPCVTISQSQLDKLWK